MKKIKYRRLKVLSLILSVIMLMCSVPMTAVAETAEPTETAEDDSYVYDVMETEEIELEATEIAQITEVESLREENVKHFKLPDGTYEMVVYGEAVHRKDSEGKWQDIDNNLELTAIKNVNMFASSDMRTAFASSFSAGQPLMTLSENGYSVSMSLVSDNINSGVELMSISEPVAPTIQNATVRENNARFDTISQAAEINNKSSIKYQNVKANTDIEYVMSGNDIKENIIIKAKGTNYIYRFDLTLDGLTPELVNNTVILKDSESGEEQYIIPEPYMYDADGNISYAVAYTLTNRGNGVYRLTVTADSSWINAEGRAFPVTVDPTIHPVVVGDTYVDQSTPSTLYYTTNHLKVSPTQTAFLIAGLPFPENVLVNTAYLNIYYYYEGNVTSGSTTVGAYQVQSEWSETTLTYNRANELSIGPWNDSVVLSGSQGATLANPKKVSFDITYMADLWTIYDSNYGVALKYISHQSNSSVCFVSSNSSSNRPSINVNYTYKIGNGVFAIENVGAEDHWLTVGSENSSYLTSTYYITSPLAYTNWDMTRLFKISKHSNMSSYIIRSMVNNCLSIQPETDASGKIYWKIVEIDPDDANVSASQTFYFSFDSMFGGYRIMPYGDLGNTIGYVSDDGSIQGDSPVNSYATWNLTKYRGADKTEYTFSLEDQWTTNGVTVGTEYTGTISGYSTVINVNRFEWTVSAVRDDVIVYQRTDAPFEWTLMAHFPGTFSINFSFYNGNLDSPQSSVTKNFVSMPSEGTYFIQNVATGLYMDMEPYVSEDSACIQQDVYSDIGRRKWVIAHYTEGGYPGYVTIQAALNDGGYYLGVDYENTSLVRRYDYIDDCSLWKIEVTETGTLTFKCQATETFNIMLAAPSANSGAGVDLEQTTTDNSSMREEWYMLKKVISYVNYYDGTFLFASIPINKIEEAVNFANDIYSVHFNVGIRMDGAAQKYYDVMGINTTAEDCDFTAYLPCGNNCGQHNEDIDEHCKSLSVIADQLIERPREADHIYVLWENIPANICCYIDDDGNHNITEFIAYVQNHSPVINFLTIDGQGVEQMYACMFITLVHETAHTFGMDDVYNVPGHDTNDQFTCVMEKFEKELSVQYYEDILSGNAQPFCTSCLMSLEGYTENIVIPAYTPSQN